MKFTVDWLRDHLDTDASLDAITDSLTSLGLEVEGVTDPRAAMAAFTTAKVIEAKPHPEADRLQICTVETNDGVIQVVCGAPNARTGMIGVFAPSGSHIPGIGIKLRKSKIRGVESNGMLLSERELGLSDEHDGIIELDDDVAVGEPFSKILGMDDPVIDIAITPNRQDCLGVHGIARDLAAGGLGTFKDHGIQAIPGTFPSPVTVELRFEKDDDGPKPCSYFVGRTVRGVKNDPSPAWLQERLQAIGLRPISALVDITNYMTFAFGRPLHVFDADKIDGGLHVRLSKTAEKVLALDGKEYELDDQVTVIADDGGALAMGGVIGGESTGCTSETQTVFIESALFDPVRTATTGRRYQIESDARHRFERGLDPEFTGPGLEEATRMVLDLCGGEASELVTSGEIPAWQKTVTLRPGRVAALGGIDLTGAQSAEILERLGFGVDQGADPFEVTVPSWRSDVGGEADLVEEVTRVYGFDKIPSVPLRGKSAITQPVLTPRQLRTRAARRALASQGLLEAVTWSFTSQELAEQFGGGSQSLRLANPISSELDAMRPSALPNLLAAAARNLDRGAENFGLFEVGPAYSGTAAGDQITEAAGVRIGATVPRQWSDQTRPADTFDAKADAMAALAAAGAPVAKLKIEASAPAWYHPGRSGTLLLGPQNPLGVFGELHPSVLVDLGIKSPAVAFQVFLDSIPQPKSKKGKVKTAKTGYAAPDLPAVERDFAFLMDADVRAADTMNAAQRADPAITNVTLFDVFTGEGVADGQKSVAIAVRLQPTDQTFTDAEIEAIGVKIVAAVAKATGGTLRT
jgi:phenylalanyl-tRNA synthetase beta chain